MAAKGSVAKEQILTKLKEVFPDGFMYEKNFVIPMMEDGQEVDIKVSMTAAKAVIEREGGTITQQVQTNTVVVKTAADVPKEVDLPFASGEPTAEEKERVANLLASLGL